MRVSVLALLLALTALAQQPAPELAPHPLFDHPAVHRIDLKFSQANYWQRLTNNYQENSDDIPYIEASFTWGEVNYEKIGVRFKGNSSYRGVNGKKKPFRLKLNEFTKGQKIGGVASYNLNNLWNDPSFIREKLYLDAAARAGLRAPRSAFANLYINGEYWGLYGLGEVVNSDWLDSRFVKEDRGGNLYKAASPGAALDYLGAGINRYTTLYEKKTNEDDATWSDLLELTKSLKELPAEGREAKLREMLDLPSVLTALALDNLTANLDSYAGMGQNYFLYRHPADGRFLWVPWDPSLAFGALAVGVQSSQLPTLPLEWSTESAGAGALPGGGLGGPGGPGGPGGGFGGAGGSTARPLTTLLWSVPAIKDEYRALYRKLVDDVLTPDRLMMDAKLLHAVLRPHVEADPNKLTTLAAFDASLTAAIPAAAAGGAGMPGGGGMPPGPGGPGGPAGAGPGGANAPGIGTLMRARDESVRRQLNQ